MDRYNYKPSESQSDILLDALKASNYSRNENISESSSTLYIIKNRESLGETQ
jgi:hypothetical protein